MTPFRRDIMLTLFIKFSLLTLLWFFCVKGMKHPLASTQQWLLGSFSHQSTQQEVKS
jgi:hypothetical protein